MATKRTTLLRQIRKGHQTKSSRACAAMAEQILGDDQETAEWRSKEARGWLKLAIEADKAAREALIAELEGLKDALKQKLDRADKVRKLSVAAGSE